LGQISSFGRREREINRRVHVILSPVDLQSLGIFAASPLPTGSGNSQSASNLTYLGQTGRYQIKYYMVTEDNIKRENLSYPFFT
jgi:hypothetical protein